AAFGEGGQIEVFVADAGADGDLQLRRGVQRAAVHRHAKADQRVGLGQVTRVCLPVDGVVIQARVDDLDPHRVVDRVLQVEGLRVVTPVGVQHPELGHRYAGSRRSVVGSVSSRSMAAVGPGQRLRYLRLNASLTRATLSESVAALARTAMRPPACTAPVGLATSSRYQRPAGPRTERTYGCSPSTTIQMVVRCTGAPSAFDVSIWISAVLSHVLRVSASNVLGIAPIRCGL